VDLAACFPTQLATHNTLTFSDYLLDFVAHPDFPRNDIILTPVPFAAQMARGRPLLWLVSSSAGRETVCPQTAVQSSRSFFFRGSRRATLAVERIFTATFTFRTPSPDSQVTQAA
jgi:hypothetical protein